MAVRRRSSHLVALFCASLLAVVTASVATASTTGRHPIPTAEASIAAPSSWTVLDTRIVTDAAAFRRFVDENPALRPFVSKMSGPGSVIKLMAFDLRLTRGFATNVNVVVTPGSPGITLGQLAPIYKQQLKTLVPTLRSAVTTRIVSLPSGKSLRASYRQGFTVGGRRLSVQTLQYLVLRSDKTLVITFSTLPELAASRNATFTAIARSLHFG
jgi:hypothetical protein